MLHAIDAPEGAWFTHCSHNSCAALATCTFSLMAHDDTDDVLFKHVQTLHVSSYFLEALAYSSFEIIGGAAAAGVFKVTHEAASSVRRRSSKGYIF